jgi:alpha-galactosidase
VNSRIKFKFDSVETVVSLCSLINVRHIFRSYTALRRVHHCAASHAPPDRPINLSCSWPPRRLLF